MSTVWVTGAAGFTGQHMLRFLKAQAGIRIVALDRVVGAADSTADIAVQFDLSDHLAVKELAISEPPKYVIHLAAATPPADDDVMWGSCVGGTINLMRGLVAANVHKNMRFINAGSAAEYLKTTAGEPITEDYPCGGEMPYGKAKWAQSVMALELGRQYGIDVVIARPFNLLGPGMPEKWVSASLCAQFSDKTKDTIKVGNTASERDFLDIRDVVEAYWAVAQKGASGEEYNICSGVPTSIQTVIDIFLEQTGHHHTVTIDQSRFRSVDLDRVYGSPVKIQSDTGWEPKISVKQSLVDMLREAQGE